jgi:hypothetical protein
LSEQPSQSIGIMALIDAIDKLLAGIDSYLAIPDRSKPPFDFEQFTKLDRAVYVEAFRLGLVPHLPKPGHAQRHSGRTNMPSGPGTMRDPPGYYYPMPSCIPAWRDELLTLRELAVKAKPPRASVFGLVNVIHFSSPVYSGSSRVS